MTRARSQVGCVSGHLRWHGDAFTDGQLSDTLTPATATPGAGNTSHRAEPVWNQHEHPQHWRASWQYSRKRAVRNTRTFTNQENRTRAVIEGEKQTKSTRFVNTTGAGRSLDGASLARARSLVGLKGYVTNIPATIMGAGEVVSAYHDLWQVEQSFRMNKSDLRARPVFHHSREAIKAHLTIVFAALAVARFVQQRTGLSIKNVVKQLWPLYSATIAINGTEQTFPPVVPTEAQRIIDAITREELTH